jgi:hypothetical protein
MFVRMAQNGGAVDVSASLPGSSSLTSTTSSNGRGTMNSNDSDYDIELPLKRTRKTPQSKDTPTGSRRKGK